MPPIPPPIVMPALPEIPARRPPKETYRGTTSSTASERNQPLRRFAGARTGPATGRFQRRAARPLSVAAATALAGHLARIWTRILDGIHHLGLILPGRCTIRPDSPPRLPLDRRLDRNYTAAATVTSFQTPLDRLGQRPRLFPGSRHRSTAPAGSGPLLLLPFCFVGPARRHRPIGAGYGRYPAAKWRNLASHAEAVQGSVRTDRDESVLRHHR